MKWEALLIVLIFQIYQTEPTSNNQYTLDLFKRENILKKFKEQLFSSLHLKKIPVANFDKSPKNIWLTLPFDIRKRMESVNLFTPKSQHDTKELFIPVKIKKNCESKHFMKNYICAGYHLDLITHNQSISTAIIFMNLPNPISSASQYLIRSKNPIFNETIEFSQYEGDLFKADITPIINILSKLNSSTVQEYEVACIHKCYDKSFKKVKMFLEVVLKQRNSLVRNRRSTNDQKICTSNEIFCCKRTFKIRPIDMGWNWIVSPDEISLHYCSGECNNYIPSHSFRKMLDFLRHSKKTLLSPLQLESMRSCCAPEKYNGLEIIYMPANNNTFQKIYLPDLLIKKCFCT